MNWLITKQVISLRVRGACVRCWPCWAAGERARAGWRAPGWARGGRPGPATGRGRGRSPAGRLRRRTGGPRSSAAAPPRPPAPCCAAERSETLQLIGNLFYRRTIIYRVPLSSAEFRQPLPLGEPPPPHQWDEAGVQQQLGVLHAHGHDGQPLVGKGEGEWDWALLYIIFNMTGWSWVPSPLFSRSSNFKWKGFHQWAIG